MSQGPRIKHRAEVVTTDDRGYTYQQPWQKGNVHEFFTDGYASREVFLRVPVGKKVGKTITYTVEVTYLGEKQYKQTLAQRTKAFKRNQERSKKWKEEQERLEVQRQEKELVQRRQRIVNQIELAFVKQGRDAVNFVTCDKCDAPATHLGLAFENPGSRVIDTDQITGAWCEKHDNQYGRPYKTKAVIACNLLEFFYDGLRQIYIKEDRSRLGPAR